MWLDLKTFSAGIAAQFFGVGCKRGRQIRGFSEVTVFQMFLLVSLPISSELELSVDGEQHSRRI